MAGRSAARATPPMPVSAAPSEPQRPTTIKSDSNASAAARICRRGSPVATAISVAAESRALSDTRAFSHITAAASPPRAPMYGTSTSLVTCSAVTTPGHSGCAPAAICSAHPSTSIVSSPSSTEARIRRGAAESGPPAIITGAAERRSSRSIVLPSCLTPRTRLPVRPMTSRSASCSSATACNCSAGRPARTSIAHRTEPSASPSAVSAIRIISVVRSAMRSAASATPRRYVGMAGTSTTCASTSSAPGTR